MEPGAEGLGADPFQLFQLSSSLDEVGPEGRIPHPLRADAVYDVAAGRVDVAVYVLETGTQADYRCGLVLAGVAGVVSRWQRQSSVAAGPRPPPARHTAGHCTARACPLEAHAHPRRAPPALPRSVSVPAGSVQDLVGNANAQPGSVTIKYRPASSSLQGAAVAANALLGASLALCTAASYAASSLLPFAHGALGCGALGFLGWGQALYLTGRLSARWMPENYRQVSDTFAWTVGEIGCAGLGGPGLGGGVRGTRMRAGQGGTDSAQAGRRGAACACARPHRTPRPTSIPAPRPAPVPRARRRLPWASSLPTMDPAYALPYGPVLLTSTGLEVSGRQARNASRAAPLGGGPFLAVTGQLADLDGTPGQPLVSVMTAARLRDWLSKWGG